MHAGRLPPLKRLQILDFRVRFPREHFRNDIDFIAPPLFDAYNIGREPPSIVLADLSRSARSLAQLLVLIEIVTRPLYQRQSTMTRNRARQQSLAG